MEEVVEGELFVGGGVDADEVRMVHFGVLLVLGDEADAGLGDDGGEVDEPLDVDVAGDER